MISLLSALLYILLFFIGYIVVNFVIIPYFRVNFYKKQGFRAFYYPVLGYIHFMNKYAKEKGQAHYLHRLVMKEDPDCKGFSVNVGKRAITFISDPELQKFILNDMSHYFIKDYSL